MSDPLAKHMLYGHLKSFSASMHPIGTVKSASESCVQVPSNSNISSSTGSIPPLGHTYIVDPALDRWLAEGSPLSRLNLDSKESPSPNSGRLSPHSFIVHTLEKNSSQSSSSTEDSITPEVDAANRLLKGGVDQQNIHSELSGFSAFTEDSITSEVEVANRPIIEAIDRLFKKWVFLTHNERQKIGVDISKCGESLQAPMYALFIEELETLNPKGYTDLNKILQTYLEACTMMHK